MQRNADGGSTALEADVPVAGPCPECGGTGMNFHTAKKCPKRNPDPCGPCDGAGFFDLDPYQPCPVRPGRLLRVAVYAGRYREGLPIFNALDFFDESQKGNDDERTDERYEVDD